MKAQISGSLRSKKFIRTKWDSALTKYQVGTQTHCSNWPAHKSHSIKLFDENMLVNYRMLKNEKCMYTLTQSGKEAVDGCKYLFVFCVWCNYEYLEANPHSKIVRYLHWKNTSIATLHCNCNKVLSVDNIFRFVITTRLLREMS